MFFCNLDIHRKYDGSVSLAVESTFTVNYIVDGLSLWVVLIDGLLDYRAFTLLLLLRRS